MLAGGLGGVTHGWKQVAKNIEIAASYATQDLGYIVEIEYYNTRIGGGEEMARSVIRVTTIFRHENGKWRLVHRQGDPIAALLSLIQMLPNSVVAIKKGDNIIDLVYVGLVLAQDTSNPHNIHKRQSEE